MAVDPFEVVVEVKIGFVLIFYVKACRQQPTDPKTMYNKSSMEIDLFGVV